MVTKSKIRHTDTPTTPSTPTWDTGRSSSALCLKTATPVAASANAAKSIATMAAVRVTPSKPGKERKVTDALNTIAALYIYIRAIRRYNDEAAEFKSKGLTIKQVQAPIINIGAGPRRSPDSSSAVRVPAKRARSRKKYGMPRQTQEMTKSKKARLNGRFAAGRARPPKSISCGSGLFGRKCIWRHWASLYVRLD